MLLFTIIIVIIIIIIVIIFVIIISYKRWLNLDYFSAFFQQGAPRIVRADCGTENVVTAGLQRYFRSNADDVFAAENSFMYGTSPANQVNR